MKRIALDLSSQGLTPRSPWRFLVKIALSVFCAETFIMLLFLSLPKLPDLVETFVDSTLLSMLITPALYFFVHRPLVHEISVRSRVEAELRQSQLQLEQQAQEQAELVKKLQQAPQLLQAAKMSSLGGLVAGIAHEINNPVNFVYANLTYTREYAEQILELLALYAQYYPNPEPKIQARATAVDLNFLKEDLIEILTSMQLGCERIRQIVLSLRNFSRMDEADLKWVDVHEGMDSTLVILQHRLKSTVQHSTISVLKDYGSLPLVACFPAQLNQVFMNILVNAIEALASTPNPTITVQTMMVDEQWVEIAIADNGSGLPEKNRDKIFEPFFTTKPIGKGIGMGLSISYQIVVEKHGGKLDYRSTLGKGTKFTIQIPLCQKKPALLSSKQPLST
jgi:two-component system, NtrC family, sensor kinase